MQNYFRLGLRRTNSLNLKFLDLKQFSTMPNKSKNRTSRPVGTKQPFLIPTELTGSFEVLPTPVKSESDKKDYKVIRLENGLTACLISDMTDENNVTRSVLDNESESDSDSESESSSDEYETDEESNVSAKSEEVDEKKLKKNEPEVKLAAAALCVGVGSFSDPKEVPGLAHFLEHMVFMGSEKYPKENDFDSHVKKHGGSDNASTDYEVTTFIFECLEKYLFESLDKFSQFFISPLMKKDSMTREREAIESEFQLALPSDENRKEQLLVGLALESSPVNSFSWGNLTTLKDNVDDDTLYQYLHEFRKRHYSAHKMTLAIQARLPLETLERYVVHCLSSVPNNNLSETDLRGYTEEIFNTSRFNKIYYINPMKNLCELNLTWMLPASQQMYETKPLEYIVWLLGHEGRGSLFSYLKEKVWALSLESDCDEVSSSIYTHFSVTIVLTAEGLSHLQQVIEAVFGYLKMLKDVGPCERIFKELQLIEDITFRFEEEEEAIDAVEDIAECMQILPPKDYLTGCELFFKYDPEAITQMLSYLTPEKLNVMVLSKTWPSEIVFDKIEPWFKTEYAEKDIPDDWLKSWQTVTPLHCFKLPEPNPFITEDFTILPFEENIPDYPEKIFESSKVELWYRKDQKFKLPIAHYYYNFVTPLATKSAESVCMLDHYLVFLLMQLAKEGYHAQIADISYNFSLNDKGFCLIIIGYNEKIPILIELIANAMKVVGDELSKKSFEAVKERRFQNLHNRLLKPSALCRDNRLSILLADYISLLDQYEAMPNITYESMVDFSKGVLNCLYVQALVQGNVTSATAVDATNNLVNILNYSPLPKDNYPRLIVNKIPNGQYCCRVQSLNEQNANSLITNYYQHGLMTLKDSVILDVIMFLLEEPLFDTLRTKEQLGYDISYSIRETYGVLGYSISVHTQANKFTTDHVDSRIEAFIERRHKALKKLGPKKFLQTKAHIALLKNAVDVDLEDEVSRNWDEIVNRTYMFDRLNRETAALAELQLEDVITWWHHHNIFNKNNTCKKISFQVVGHCVNCNASESKPMSQDVASTEMKPESSNLIDSEVVGPSTNPSTDCVAPTDAKKGEAKEVKLYFLENLEEIKMKSRNDDYFIKDIHSFKSKLQPYDNIG